MVCKFCVAKSGSKCAFTNGLRSSRVELDFVHCAVVVFRCALSSSITLVKCLDMIVTDYCRKLKLNVGLILELHSLRFQVDSCVKSKYFASSSIYD